MSILPIGTIVYLKEGTQKLMIINRGVTLILDKENVLFDYSAVLYPTGLNPEQILYFNQEDIDSVIFHGFSDLDEERFATLFQKWITDNQSTIKKGRTK